MKKLVLLLGLSLLATSCKSPTVGEQEEFTPYVVIEDELPTFYATRNANITVYLLMGKYGSISYESGYIKGDVSEKFYENTIVYKGEPGSALPDSSSVYSIVSGVTFRGWAYYNPEYNSDYPEYYTTVPEVDGLALRAIFDGTDPSSGGGQSLPTSGYGLMFTDESYVAGVSLGLDYEGYDQYMISNYCFIVGKSFSLCNFQYNATWVADINSWSFGDTSGSGTKWKSYLSKGSSSYTVLQTFTADVYMKFKYEQDNVYFELK